MGLGPWAQGELIRAIKRAERARFRRLLNREEKYLRSLIGNPETGEIMRGDLEGAFHRIRSGIAERKKRAAALAVDARMTIPCQRCGHPMPSTTPTASLAW